MQSYISREQDYALRITASLASLDEDEFLPVSKLSNDLFISKNFAARIVHKLKNNGIIKSIQGKYGGVSLAKAPSDISVYDVLAAIGFRTQFNKCLSDGFVCELEMLCRYHAFFANEETQLYNRLKEKTIDQFLFYKK